MASEVYRGPHAVFTDEELKHIHLAIGGAHQDNSDLRHSILEKIERALGSDPKWRQPPP